MAVAKLITENFATAQTATETHRRWRWQFRDPHTKGSWVCIADIGGVIGAHYAVMRLPMIYDGQEILGAVSTATVTDRQFRGRGLFTLTATKVYEWAADDGAAIVFGFPNSQSMPGFIRKLDWFEIERLPVFVRVLQSHVFVRRFLKVKWLSLFLGTLIDKTVSLACRLFSPASRNAEFEIESVADFEPEMNELWRSTFLLSRTGVKRDCSYFRWRYIRNPDGQYSILRVTDAAGNYLGLSVLGVKRTFDAQILYILDCLVLNDRRDVARALLEKIESTARSLNTDAIAVLLVRGHPLRREFIRNGYLKVPNRFFPQDVFYAARANNATVETSQLKNPAGWYISWGDEDVV